MRAKTIFFISVFATALVIFVSARVPFMYQPSGDIAAAGIVKRYLYVATPGIRDYLGYGGHGILVFDIDNHHRFVKRIPTKGFHPDHTPSNVKVLL